MKEQNTEYGKVLIGEIEDIFNYSSKLLNEAAKTTIEKKIQIGLTGGSTPKAYYKWCTENKPFSDDLLLNAVWSVSDERFVSTDSDESNFGTADRLMLTPLGIANDRKKPWPTDGDPDDAAKRFSDAWKSDVGADKGFDLCFLGMGDDCHTASIFPESTLIEAEIINVFSSVKVPEKGWRLTITPYGLSRCQHIVITATGEGKNEALKSVFKDEFNPMLRPVQLSHNFSDKVTWLLDPAAAKDLF